MVEVFVRRPIFLALTIAVSLVPVLLGATCGLNLPVQPSSGDGGGGGGGGLTGKFVGAAVCQQCHDNIHQNWAGTQHAKALDTLAAIGQSTNAQCLPCHTVGFGEEGGYVDAATTSELAGVQCENCHGAALDHVRNVEDKTLRPVVSISADVCGKCHQGPEHPTLAEWSGTGHAAVVPDVATSLSTGTSATSCGVCHSGDVRFASLIQGDTITDAFLNGVPTDKLNAVTCAICHDPHKQTGNAVTPETGGDYQLRYAEVVALDPINDITKITDPTRYNLCGQCHHDRGKDWTATSRGPHHSIQSSVYAGEMPIKTGDPLVPNTRSVHRFVPKQCVTCHMYTKQAQTDTETASSGHAFTIDTAACTAVGCHPSADDAANVKKALQAEVKAGLDSIAARLGPLSTWGYSSEGGPADQSGISTEVQKIRFMYFYITNDLSLGVHNPAYVRSMLQECDQLLTSAGK